MCFEHLLGMALVQRMIMIIPIQCLLYVIVCLCTLYCEDSPFSKFLTIITSVPRFAPANKKWQSNKSCRESICMRIKTKMHTQYDSNNSSAHTEHYSQALAHRQAVSTERNEPPIIYDSQVQNWQSSQPRTILSVRVVLSVQVASWTYDS